jgi:hypothetical protein
MGLDSSKGKRGLKSSARKRTTTRSGGEETPATRPVAGAYGREGLDRETGGKPRVPSEPGKKDRARRRSRRAA